MLVIISYNQYSKYMQYNSAHFTATNTASTASTYGASLTNGYTPAGNFPSYFGLIDNHVLSRASTVLVEENPGFYKVIKARNFKTKKYIDINSDLLLSEFKFLKLISFTPNLCCYYSIDNCKFKVKLDLKTDVIEFINYAGSRILFEEFITKAPAEATKPFLYELNFFRYHEGIIDEF